jgi:uncharacterized protein YgiM (DUF1202 family)
MNRWVAMASGGVGLALAAAILAETTYAIGAGSNLLEHWRVQSGPVAFGPWRFNWPVDLPTVTPSPSPTATASVTPVPTVAITLTSTPSPTVAPRVFRTARTSAFVHLRAGASTASAILLDLNGGTTVELLDYQDASWQQVRYNGVMGYIFRSYLTY